MKILYEDQRLKVYQTDIPEEHGVIVDNIHCYLSRGILKECANTDTGGLRQRLEAVNWLFLIRISEKGVTLEELGWALAKARMRELEEEVNYFVRMYNEVRG